MTISTVRRYVGEARLDAHTCRRGRTKGGDYPDPDLGRCGQPDRELRPRVVVLDADLSVMGSHDIAHDLQAKTSATVITGASLVEPREPFEYRVTLLLWNARTVIGDGQGRLGWTARQSYDDPAARMPYGVVEKVAHCPRQHRRITANIGSGHTTDVDSDLGAQPRALNLREHEVIQIHRATLSCWCGVKTGERQQVIDEAS